VATDGTFSYFNEWEFYIPSVPSFSSIFQENRFDFKEKNNNDNMIVL
jgi:hypothetical protein